MDFQGVELILRTYNIHFCLEVIDWDEKAKIAEGRQRSKLEEDKEFVMTTISISYWISTH